MKGPVLLMLGIGLFGVLDANSKFLSGDFSAAQALTFRHATLLLLLFLLRAAWPGTGGDFRTGHPRLHALRAVAMLCSGLMFFLAFRHLPLADGYLVFFTAPFMTLVLARLALRESVPRAAWIWSGVGFAGVLLALMPSLSGGGSAFGFLCAALGTVTYAVNITVNRSLKAESGIARLVLFPSTLGLLATAPFAGLHWVTPDVPQALALMANGILAGTATVLLALAFRHATPARLAPFEFIALPWSVTLDWLVFGNAPAGPTIAGGVVVALACLMSERAVIQGTSSGKR
ncbi:DMT family transporter [Sabulicella glaciei]|uniref:DMT family transporter n=1 Tax=Sabulicella glaciei TaxID=2984948 RepID=A0ABT3NUD8_9PROT|nr:DMT family transporter [Roseococcus sp. MDT2-1-1]MCW8085775.1 DMT family transporter [Roseococcus sp. MDT2-1-1]